ncbi:MAG: DUF4149 domain-containing protein [Pseudomonadota bacterium]
MSFADFAAVLAAASLGAMLFFSAIVAPTTFKALPEEHAGQFLRTLFPYYFEINGVVAIAAGLLALRPLESVLLVAAGAMMVAVKIFLIPIINAARDEMLAGSQSAKADFDRWHRLSVIINVVEMVMLVLAIILLLR